MTITAKRKLAKRKEVVKLYYEYRKKGLPMKEAWRWAFTIANFAKDHWHKPTCGW